MPKATQEAGTELIVASGTVAVGGAWADEATAGSEVFRQGPLVTLALRVKNTIAVEAWKAAKWKKGEIVSKGGHLYETIVAEVEEAKKGDEPQLHPEEFKDLGPATAICTLPPEYWPAAVVKDATTATVEVGTDGKVTALDSLTESKARVYFLVYRAAQVSP